MTLDTGGYHVQVIDTNPMKTYVHQLYLVKIGHILGCLEGVWRLSGWCLKTSGRCVGKKDEKQVVNSRVGVMILS